jgi:hypothetical protein
MNLFLSQIATLLMGNLVKTKRDNYSPEERQRILGVLKAMVG